MLCDGVLVKLAEWMPRLDRYRHDKARQYRKLGLQEYGSGGIASAIKYFKLALRWTSGDTNLRCDLAQLHYQLKEFDQAEKEFKRALRRDSKDLRALKGLGI